MSEPLDFCFQPGGDFFYRFFPESNRFSDIDHSLSDARKCRTARIYIFETAVSDRHHRHAKVLEQNGRTPLEGEHVVVPCPGSFGENKDTFAAVDDAARVFECAL